MRVAIPYWQGRVSPVFDVAANFLLIDIEGGREIRREDRPLVQIDPFARVAEFLSFGAGVLICGAISTSLQAKLIASGVQVIGFACGNVEEVLDAHLSGQLESRAFAMPGCKKRSGDGIKRESPGTRTECTDASRGKSKCQDAETMSHRCNQGSVRRCCRPPETKK